MKILNKLPFVAYALILFATLQSCNPVRLGHFNLKYSKLSAKEQLHGNSSPQSVSGDAVNTKVAEQNISPLKPELVKEKEKIVLTASPTKNKTVNPLPNKKLSKEERKEIKGYLKESLKQKKRDNDSGIAVLLLVIIAILLPPLAVALVDGITGPFWLSILLTLLFYFPGLIYALWRIFR